jgi:hypothetical protein
MERKKVQFSAEEETFKTNIAFTPSLARNPIYVAPEERSIECVAPSNSSITRPHYEGMAEAPC